MTLSTNDIAQTMLSISDTQHNNILILCWVSHFIYCYAECHYAACLFAECHYAECPMRNVIMRNVIMLHVIMLSAIMLSVVVPSIQFPFTSNESQ